MTEDFTIQCENCGTIYNDLEEVCPYCGQPQPAPVGDEALLRQEYYEDDLPAAEGFPPDQDQLLADDLAAEDLAGLPLSPEYPAVPDELPAEAYLDHDDLAPAADPLLDDDIFAVAQPEQETYEAPYADYHEPYQEYDHPDEYDELELEEETVPRRFSKRRLLLGCLGTFLCIGLFYGGIGLLATYRGLQERLQLTQAEAETHYQKGQEHLANNSLELAIAEFERALNLNPNLLAAREALREAQRLAQSQPTPTSETRSAAAAELLAMAEEQITQKNWSEAAQSLARARELDADYQAAHLSELIYTANYELGLQLTTPDQIEEAVLAFESALAERPEDSEVNQQIDRALLYIEGKTNIENDKPKAIEAFEQLYRAEPDYLDVQQRLLTAYEAYGDDLLAQEAWCPAETQYNAAIELQAEAGLRAKAETSHNRCQESGLAQATRPPSQPHPRATAITANPGSDFDPSGNGAPLPTTPSAEATPAVAATSGGGVILFSAFNPNESRWEILSVPARGGAPKVVQLNATMPALSPNGQLVYHSELIESEGLHLVDLTTGEDRRITTARHHILPRWGGDNSRFLFVAQEPATNRWQIHLAFADGKSDPLIVRDGRTPDWSPDNKLIAYQGTDPQGNNPGLYVVPFDGGQAARLTDHESDRMPDFSPNGSQLVYMSTRSGNWDIYITDLAGGPPRQITTSPGNDGLPVWSPDGSQIAYVSDADGSWAIYVISAAGGKPFKVTEWDGRNRPDWLLAQIWWSR